MAGDEPAAAEGTIHWRDLAVSVGGELKTLPHSGSAYAGRLLAVMGPSGAGKSLLLHALAGLAPSNSRVGGQVWDAGGKVPVGVADGTVALLEQDVPFFSELTSRETLQFAAELEGLPARAAAQNADALLRRVGLQAVADSKVGERYLGSSGHGLSGGEQRRLAVACAVAGEDLAGLGGRRAKSLLADEPTTGLDTFQAAETVQLLREMAVERRCAAIMSIHQPRSSVWGMIDDVLIIGPGGRVVYVGPTAEVLAHFSALGHACPKEGVNPAEFLVDLVSVRASGSTGRSADQDRVESLSSAFRVQQAAAVFAGTLPEPLGFDPRAVATAAHHLGSTRAFWLLFRRAVMQTSRDKVTNFGRLLATAGLGFIFGAQFGKFPNDPMLSASVGSRVSLLSFGGISMAFIGEMRALDRFAKEKKVISRERAASRYSGFVYLAAKAIAELPSDALFAALFGLIVSNQCNLRSSTQEVVAACALVAAVCAAMGLAIGAAVPNAERAMIAGVPIMVLHMLTGIIDPSGKAGQTPNAVMLALQSASPIRYVIEALCNSELGGAQLAWNPKEAAKLGALAFARSGDSALENLGVVRSYREAMVALAVLGVVHLALAALFLAWLTPPSRRAQPVVANRRVTLVKLKEP